MKILFWTCGALILLCYCVYPVLLFVVYCLAQLKRDLNYLTQRTNRRAPILAAKDMPAVTVVVAAYNEVERLPAKIANIEEIDYPKDKLKFIFVSDGSTDGTTELLSSLSHPNVCVLVNQARTGKPTALNKGIAHANTELLVLSDASTLFAPDTIQKLVRHFENPTIGVVCGSLQFQHIASTGGNEAVFWGFEGMLRLMESRLGATLTASGALYAIRKSCYPRLTAHAVVDDLLVPMHARRLGYGVAYDPEAIAYEIPASTIEGEYVRRIRIAAGSFRVLAELIRVPMPPFTWFAFLCHKVLRWTVPFLLLGLLISNLFILNAGVYRVFLTVQLMFYGWAALGYIVRRHAARLRFLLLGYFVVSMNIAFIVGFFRFIRSSQRVTWERVN